MRSKLFSRLMSFTLSATVALTSGIPALAYDGGGGELPEEELEILDLEEEEDLGSDFDVLEEDIVEDEVFLEEEQEDAEFEALNDAELTFDAAAAHRKAFTLSGDLGTIITEGATVDFDSTRDFVFYVAPEMGYGWATGTDPVTLAGTFTYKGESEYAAVKGTDYKIEASDISEANIDIDSDGDGDGYNIYDFSLAKKVTIIGGSPFSKALAKTKAALAYGDGSDVFATAPAGSITPPAGTVLKAELTVTIPAATVQTVQLHAAYGKGLTKPSVDMAVTAYRPAYDSDYNQNITGLISTADATKTISVKVAMVNGDTVTPLTDQREDNPDAVYSDNGTLSYWYKDGVLRLTEAAVEDAYVKAKSGQKLTVIFEEAIAGTAILVDVKPASTDYITYAKIDKPVMANATKITTAGTTTAKDEDYYFFAYPVAGGDSTRRIINIQYKTPGNAVQNAADIKVKVNASGTSFEDENATGYGTNTDTEIAYTPEAGGAFIIDNSAVTNSITLSAVTGEQVSINGAYTGSAGAGSATATFTVNGNSKDIDSINEVLTAGKTDSNAGSPIFDVDDDSEAITGKDYTFTVLPVVGKKITSVTVDMYDIKGTNKVTCTVENGKLIDKGYGVYTVPKITGRLAVNLNVEAENFDCSVVVEPATGSSASDVAFYRWSDSVALPTTAATFARQGEKLKFKAIPAAGKAIKKLSYAFGDGEYQTLSGTMDAAGNTVYEITVTGNLKLKFESVVGYKFTKKANPNAVVKINGIEVKDGASIAHIPAGTGIPVSITGIDDNVKVVNRLYKFAAADPGYTNYGTSGDAADAAWATNKVSQWTNEDATLLPSETEASDADTNEYFIYVMTERKEEASKYTSKTVISGEATALDALTLYAGGTALTTPTNKKHTATLSTTFKKADGTTIVGGTTKYAVAKTGVSAVADVSTATITSTKNAGTDEITITQTVAGTNWLDQMVYTATLPLTVKSLNTYYDGGLELVSTVTSNTPVISTMAGAGKTTLRVELDETDLTVLPYTINPATGKKVAGTPFAAGDITVANSGTTKEIESIKWATTPAFVESQLNGALLIAPSTASGATVNVSNVKDPGTINVIATVTYVDGSKNTATIDITAVAKTLGYGALEVVTVGGKTSIESAAPTIALERKSGGINSATVKFRVFEKLDASTWGSIINDIKALNTDDPTVITEENLTKYLAGDGSKKIKEVTATYAEATGTYKTDGVVKVTANSDGYTITANKIGTGSTIIPVAAVNGIEVAANPIRADVTNILPAQTVTLNIDDAAGAVGYRKPQLKTSAAILSYSHSNSPSDKQGEITDLIFDGLAQGTIIKLPTVNDFDSSTIDPKRTLIGWDLGAGTPQYVAPGKEYVVPTGAAPTVSAIWANKYSPIKVFNDTTDTALTGTEVLGIGVSTTLSLRYGEIDWEKTPDNTGAPVYFTAVEDLSSANTELTISQAVADSTAITISGNTITGNAENSTAGLNFAAKVDGVEYTPVPASATYAVATNVAYKLEMDAITVEEGQTKRFAAAYYEATKTKDDAVNLPTGSKATIKAGGENNAEAKVVAGTKLVEVTGLKAGTTATLVLTAVSVQGEKKEIEVPITVTETKKKIVVKNSKTTDIQIPANNAATYPVTFNYTYDGTVQDATGTWTVEKIDDPEDLPTSAKLLNMTNVTVTPSGTSDATVNLAKNASTFGTGKIKVTYTVNATTSEKFSAWFDVNSYYSFTYNVQTGAEVDGRKFVVKNDGTAVKNSENIEERFVYNGSKKHTSEKAAKYIAEYSEENTTGELYFFGWDFASGATAYTATEALYEPGKAITLDESYTDLADPEGWPFTTANGNFSAANANINLYAQFGQKPIQYIVGLDSAITLTDAYAGTTATEISSGSRELTDYIIETIEQSPADSTAPIKVTADDVGLFTIKDGSSPDRNDAGSADWKTGSVAGFNVAMTAIPATGTPTSREGSFTIAKVAGKVGVSEIHVTAGDLEYNIPIVLNGEFVDPDDATVKHYMENGEILQNGTRVVGGKTHYYKDGVLVTNGVIDVSEGGTPKLIIVENNVWVKTPGLKVFKDKTYYIGADGYLSTGLVDISGKKFLFREDGSKVFHNDSDVKDGKIKVAGITYVINSDDTAEVDDILYNAKVNWTKKFDSKYTKGTGLPEIQYTISYTSKNTGKTETTEVKNATVTCDGDYAETSTATQLTFTATASLEGYWKTADAKEAATAAPISETYKFKNGGLEGTTGQDIGGDMMVEGLEDEYFFTGSAIKPVITVTDGDMVLAQGVDYTVKYKNNTKISSKSGDEYTKTAEVTVTGKGNYAGQAQTLYFAIIDPKDEVKEDDADLTGAKIKLASEKLYYTGEPVYPSAIELKLKGGSFVTYKHQGGGLYSNDDGDIPAVVTFSNNVNKGSATVMLTGKANAKGVTKTLKKSFTIKAAEMNTTDYTVTVDPESAAWAVKGAQPAVAVTWEGYDLVPGQDFTVSYDKSNKKVGPSKVTVKGKGNFAKKLEASFTVVALPLSEEMVAAVSAVVGKKGAKVTLLDGVGNVIPTSLYTVSVFDGETDVTKAKLEAEKDYTIKIAKKAGKTELGDDALEITAQAGIDIKSAKVNAKSVVKTYTGEAITLTDEDIAKIAVTYKGATLVAGTDYEITGYANNIKKGSMTVTIKGIGKYSGAKTFKVKIAPKPIKATN